MPYNEQETRFYLIDPLLRDKGYHDHRWIKLETLLRWNLPVPKGDDSGFTAVRQDREP